MPVFTRSTFLSVSLCCLIATNASLSQTVPANPSPPATPNAPIVRVVEYYRSDVDHYFITADPGEIAILDRVPTWQRTGANFLARAVATPTGDWNPVCRFYGKPEAGLDSHFYSGSPDECAGVAANFAKSWKLEAFNVFLIRVPDHRTGTCPADTVPVYRLYNKRADVNHRYVTDVTARQQLLARGYVSEGYGPDGVAFCAESNGSVDDAPSGSGSAGGASVGTTVTMDVAQSAPRTFVFSAVAKAAPGASVRAFVWNFGDGITSSGTSVSHEYQNLGTYEATVTVIDSETRTATAKMHVTATADSGPLITPPLVTMLVSQTAPDTFDFGSSAIAAPGANIVGYAWNFGDGGTGAGPTGTHRYEVAGDYPVVLTVIDSNRVAASASKTVSATKPPAQPPTSTPPTNGSPATGTASDFEARKSAAGVVRWFDFDTQPPIQSTGPRLNFGIDRGDNTTATLDTAVKASGAGSLRFDIPDQSYANAAGAFFANFSPDLKTQFGENTEFYVQWRQRFSQAMVSNRFLDDATPQGSQGGIKQAIITTGDQADASQVYGLKVYNSCEAVGNVVTSEGQNRFPIAYNSCTGSASHGPYAGLATNEPGGDFGFQNAVGCNYIAVRHGDLSKCLQWQADEWMTFEIRTKLGPRAGDDFAQSEFQLWGAREGQNPILLIDWKPGVGGYFPLAAGPAAENQRFGKVWLLPYMTHKGPGNLPLASTWYDELIISAQPIKFPGGFDLTGVMPASTVTASPTSTAQPTPIAPTPAPPAPVTTGSLAALKSGELREIGPIQCKSDPRDSAPCFWLTDFSGMVYDAKRNRMVLFGGGHSSTNYDGVLTLNMADLSWREEYPPTPFANMTPTNYDRDLGAWKAGPAGPYPRPAARHTIDGMSIVNDELIVAVPIEGNGWKWDQLGWTPAMCLNGDLNVCAQGGRIAHYSLTNKSWSFGPAAQSLFPFYPGTALDPVSGKIVALGSTAFALYDPATKTGVRPIDPTAYYKPDQGDLYWIKDESGKGVTPNLSNTLSYNTPLVYSAADDAFYTFVHPGTDLPFHVLRLKLNRNNPRDSTLTLLTTSGDAPGNTYGAAYDSKNKIIGVGPYKGKFYAFDPVTKVWTSKPVAAPDLAFMALDYDAADGVFVFIGDRAQSGGTGKAFAYRW